MGMGTRQAQEKQEEIWIANVALARSPGHPFYQRLNELLDGEKFDEFVEGLCGKFNAPRFGRPSLAPGIYFRSLLIGYFEGIDSERGIAWRLADSLALRQFVRIGITEQSPDHSTISRTRRLIDVETHRAVFGWVLGLLADRGLIQGKREGVNATTLEAHGSDCRLAIVGTGTPELLEQEPGAKARAAAASFHLCPRAGGAVSSCGRGRLSLPRDYHQRCTGNWAGIGKDDRGQRSTRVSRAADGPGKRVAGRSRRFGQICRCPD